MHVYTCNVGIYIYIFFLSLSVYIYVYIHIYIYTHTYIHLYIHVYIYTYVATAKIKQHIFICILYIIYIYLHSRAAQHTSKNTSVFSPALEIAVLRHWDLEDLALFQRRPVMWLGHEGSGSSSCGSSVEAVLKLGIKTNWIHRLTSIVNEQFLVTKNLWMFSIKKPFTSNFHQR